MSENGERERTTERPVTNQFHLHIFAEWDRSHLMRECFVLLFFSLLFFSFLSFCFLIFAFIRIVGKKTRQGGFNQVQWVTLIFAMEMCAQMESVNAYAKVFRCVRELIIIIWHLATKYMGSCTYFPCIIICRN